MCLNMGNRFGLYSLKVPTTTKHAGHDVMIYTDLLMVCLASFYLPKIIFVFINPVFGGRVLCSYIRFAEDGPGPCRLLIFFPARLVVRGTNYPRESMEY